LGRFENGADFHIYSKLFREHELAVNLQLFSIVNEIERTIEACKWYIYSTECNEKLEVYDVQIMDGCEISLRVRWQGQFEGHK
jgi:hypothetical protein